MINLPTSPARETVGAMSAALSIQLALFREQQSRIDSLVGTPSAAFKNYEAEYRRHSAQTFTALPEAELQQRLSAARVIYVGDYHSLPASQRGFLQLAETQLRSPSPLVLALECVDLKHQRSVDTFLKSTRSLEWLARQLGHRNDGSATLWANFAPLFQWAREHHVSILAIDSRASGKHSLSQRDAAAAKAIQAALHRPSQPRIMVLMGQFHVAPKHLPLQVSKLSAPQTFNSLTVYQNAESPYWRLARADQLHATPAIQFRDGTVCLFNSSPTAAQRSFLDFAEAMLGEAVVSQDDLQRTFSKVATVIAKQFGVDVASPLKSLEIFTAESVEPLLKRLKAHQLSAAHVKAIRGHILSQESAFLPAARAVYLSSFSLSHLAEEAAHFVRHVAVGSAMTRRRHSADAFWARCLEEAIGYFGSKLVNPGRRSHSLADWQREFTSGTPQYKREAAFVLALMSAHDENHAALIPLGDLELFHRVSHALGYLLGEALFTHSKNGRLTLKDLRALVADPLEHPAQRWLQLTHQCLPASRRNASTAKK